MRKDGICWQHNSNFLEKIQGAGNRIKNVKIKGQDLDPKKLYKPAVNNYRFGTLQNLKLATQEDVYYDSYELMQDAGRIRDLIGAYVKEKDKGVITPKVNYNWKIIGFDPNVEGKDKILDEIRAGTIQIPRSADGRTPNVKSINVHELKK